jgi:hypothetical protein
VIGNETLDLLTIIPLFSGSLFNPAIIAELL